MYQVDEIKKVDPVVADYIEKEVNRQNSKI